MSSNAKSAAKTVIRRRISRACDQCNQLRTRCDGLNPCAHCISFGLECKYARERKKRGKASKKELLQQQQQQQAAQQAAQQGVAPPPPPPPQVEKPKKRKRSNTMDNVESEAPESRPLKRSATVHSTPQFDQRFQDSIYDEMQFPMQPVMSTFTPTENPPMNYMVYPQMSPVSAVPPLSYQWMPETALRYPVLLPLLPQIRDILSQEEACDLLEVYFSQPGMVYPTSPYVLTQVLKKEAMLHPTHPRTTSAALLASILCLACQSDNNKGNASQKLLELCIELLKPLVHSSGEVSPSDPPSLDDVLTYINLALVLDNSEVKHISMRWWSSAWTLARELRLNREYADDNKETPDEVKEERRRTWWLLYMVDRHLALCYNRPLAFLDAESVGVYMPEENFAFDTQRRTGLSFRVAGRGMFSCFLPLMHTLGGIIEIHHARNAANGPLYHLENRISELRAQINAYLDLNSSNHYCAYVAHVLHILLAEKWDPVELLDDENLWISSATLMTSASHAISATETLGKVLELDPDLRSMPDFLHVYFLHASLLLLSLADRLQAGTDSVVGAFRTAVRGHEILSARSGTVYQLNLLKHMRIALAKVSGEPLEDDDKLQRRRILMMHRWNGYGVGLAP